MGKGSHWLACRQVRVGTIVIVCVVAGGCWLLVGASRARLQLDATGHDLGEITPTEKVPVAFTLRSTGSETLCVTGLDATCGCAKPKIDRDVIPPGEAATIDVAFTAPERSGVFEHAVFFQTNDPDRRTVVLRLAGRAFWPIEAVPANLYFGIVRVGETASADFELADRAETPIAVTALEPSAPVLRIEQIKTTALARTYRVSFCANRPGPIEETIRITTDHPKRPALTVGVSGEVVTSSGVEPKSLLLGMQRPGAMVEPRLTVHGDVASALESVQLRAACDGWSLRRWTSQAAPPQGLCIAIALQVPGAAGYHRNALLIKAKNEPEPFEIPISCLVSAE